MGPDSQAFRQWQRNRDHAREILESELYWLRRAIDIARNRRLRG